MEQRFIQLFLRLAVATTFLSAVADRIGLWGENASWGNWENFLEYSNTLNFYAPEILKEPLAVTATGLEVVFAFLLFFGYQTRIAARLSGLLLIIFALTMTFSLGIKLPFDYSVWISAGTCFLLGNVDKYDFSLDNYLTNGKKNKHTRT